MRVLFFTAKYTKNSQSTQRVFSAKLVHSFANLAVNGLQLRNSILLKTPKSPILYYYSFLIINIVIFSFHSSFSQSIGNGKHASPTISGIINQYTSLLSDAYRCNYKIEVNDNSFFERDDLLLIIQMQGAEIDNSNTASYGEILNYKNCGNFEYAVVDSVVGLTTLILKYSLLNNYSANGKTQIVEVPQYVNPIIGGMLTCPEWNGETGGILALDAMGIITLQDDLYVNGKGFRGGEVMKGHHFFGYAHDYVAESYNPDWFSLKGEGIAFFGVDEYTSGRGSAANSGGGGNIHTSGGGGGSNYGEGGNGGWGYPVDTLNNELDVQGLGGKKLGYDTLENRIFMGGGGGAGHEHFGNGTDGARGGGMVLITAATIMANSNRIWANGNSSASSGGYGDGTGGAGAGGTVVLAINQFLDSLNVYIQGGNGGSSILKGFGPGGGGGGGICLLSSSLQSTFITIMDEGGMGGLAGGYYYGADAGSNGGIKLNSQIPMNNSYPGLRAQFSYDPQMLSDYCSTISFANESSGATHYFWDFGDETTSEIQNPEHYYTLGNYLVKLIASDSICSDTAIANLEYWPIANVITPNQDDINDRFIFPLSENDTLHLQIFSRWGIPVFDKTGINISWDGTYINKLVSDGVYYYTATLGSSHIYHGFIYVFH